MVTFPEILTGFCSDRSYECAYKIWTFVALPVPEIIGVLKKFGQSLDTPTLPFLQNFEWAFVQIDPVNA